MFASERGAAHVESKGDVRVLVEVDRVSYGLTDHRFVPRRCFPSSSTPRRSFRRGERAELHLATVGTVLVGESS